jgi:hypothetical protein
MDAAEQLKDDLRSGRLRPDRLVDLQRDNFTRPTNGSWASRSNSPVPPPKSADRKGSDDPRFTIFGQEATSCDE